MSRRRTLRTCFSTNKRGDMAMAVLPQIGDCEPPLALSSYYPQAARHLPRGNLNSESRSATTIGADLIGNCSSVAVKASDRHCTFFGAISTYPSRTKKVAEIL